MKKLCLLLTLCLALTACSASSDKAISSPAMAESSAPMEDVEMSMDTATSVGGGATTKQTQDSKFIYTLELEAETTTFEDHIQALQDLVDSMDGYFEYASQQDRGSYRYGSYTIRIPAEDLNHFTTQASSLFLVTDSTSMVDNISYEYYDTKGRLETQELKLERLQELLEQAETMEDLITLESAISQTQEAIDAYSGNMVYYDDQVNFATVHLSLREVSTLSNVEQTPVGFGGRLSNAFTNGILSFIDSMENLAIFLAYNWLTLLFWAVIILAIVRFTRHKRPKSFKLPKRKKKDSQPPQE